MFHDEVPFSDSDENASSSPFASSQSVNVPGIRSNSWTAVAALSPPPTLVGGAMSDQPAKTPQ